jgi:hypothetical protein
MAAIGYEMEWMKLTRGMTLGAVKSLSNDQLLKVPQNFNNNILWNVGHLLYSQCAFFYGLTQQPFPLPAGSADLYKSLFDDATSPKTWNDHPDIPALLDQYASITDTIVADAKAGKFDGFKATELFPGMTLHSVAEIAGFQCVHEGMHYGAISALKKFV